MGVVIDSSVLIDFERGRIDPAPHVQGREDEEFFISVITASELLHGVRRATSRAIRSRRSAFVEAILERFPVLAVDLPVSRIHAQIWSDLEPRGIMIGLHDCWLAATCIANGYSLVTSNLRDFKKIPGLRLESWST
ncbi:MAG TPA: type II toxin-antitoxin system VapC family toxin [Acidobacteriota bacterium]|nr:type II toxin-antitoxin system VapC family toxin [Acidobacteriota bacterium]